MLSNLAAIIIFIAITMVPIRFYRESEIMGDMADEALERLMDWDEAVENGYYDDPENQEDGLIPMLPFYSQPKACGPGKCPSCGAKTVLLKGKYGAFYGCTTFPKCHGSRNP